LGQGPCILLLSWEEVAVGWGAVGRCSGFNLSKGTEISSQNLILKEGLTPLCKLDTLFVGGSSVSTSIMAGFMEHIWSANSDIKRAVEDNSWSSKLPSTGRL